MRAPSAQPLICDAPIPEVESGLVVLFDNLVIHQKEEAVPALRANGR